MRHMRPLVITLAILGVACSDDGGAASTAPAAADDTEAGTASVPGDICSVLSSADFADVGFTVVVDGQDVSENFNLATTTSSACQWMTDDDNIASSWELVIGSGDAQAAFDFDLSFAELDSVTSVAIGDESFLVDEASSLDAADHDFAAGVRIGDVYFTISTTDDRGSDAIAALAQLVADRLTT
ncbi:MAG: hypothetical protein HY826_08860 [Actinobacteria bacterium]|nr:hypothetical protein [Actinomycetota bacterium]